MNARNVSFSLSSAGDSGLFPLRLRKTRMILPAFDSSLIRTDAAVDSADDGTGTGGIGGRERARECNSSRGSSLCAIANSILSSVKASSTSTRKHSSGNRQLDEQTKGRR